MTYVCALVFPQNSLERNERVVRNHIACHQVLCVPGIHSAEQYLLHLPIRQLNAHREKNLQHSCCNSIDEFHTSIRRDWGQYIFQGFFLFSIKVYHTVSALIRYLARTEPATYACRQRWDVVHSKVCQASLDHPYIPTTNMRCMYIRSPSGILPYVDLGVQHQYPGCALNELPQCLPPKFENL